MRDLVHFVVGVRVVLGMVVGPVFEAGIPVVAELVLRATALEPPEVHIHHLDPAEDNCFVGNTCSGRGSGPENDIFSSSPKIIFECSNLLF